jgi:type II secretory pathway component PulJ
MKPATLILVASLTANALFVAFAVRRPAPNPPGPAPAGSDRAARNSAALATALANGDVAALRAAGIPEDSLRALELGRALRRFVDRSQEIRSKFAGQIPYWRQNRGADSPWAQMRPELLKAQREFSGIFQSIYGQDIEGMLSTREPRYSYLSPQKRDELRRIEQDYNEMQAQIYAEQAGVELPSDREKLRLLRLERERDLLAALNPEEREQYELHESPAARSIMWRYGAALETEADFKKMYAIQKAYNDDYSSEAPRSPAQLREFRAAGEQVRRDLDAMLTPQQVATLQRANDSDLSLLSALTQRLNLPASATDSVLALRSSYAAQSLQINADPTLSDLDRRLKLQALATRAQSDLRGSLGVDAAQTYANRSNWVGILKGGSAFSTNPKDAMLTSESFAGVYRVMGPARRRPPSATPTPSPTG